MSTRRAAKLVRRAKRKAKKMTFKRRVRAAGHALAKLVIAKRVAEVRKEETA